MVWLKTEQNLSDNTVRRRCGIAKQFFKAAVRKGLSSKNPFADLTSKRLFGWAGYERPANGYVTYLACRRSSGQMLTSLCSIVVSLRRLIPSCVAESDGGSSRGRMAR